MTDINNKITVPELDAILGEKFKVLDDGFIRVVDYMGGDSSVVQAARVSYGAGTKSVSEDSNLIRYLMRHEHMTPFEMCEIKLHVRVPMDIWRQWVRHRTASINEYSTRYSIAIDSTAETGPNSWRLQSTDNKQGSAFETLPFDDGEILSKKEKELHEKAREVYNERINKGVAREQARKDLPLSTYTEAYWKVDLRNLLNFLKLRVDSSAQLEIRQYANVICDEILSRWCPNVHRAFIDYQVSAITLSHQDQQLLAAWIKEAGKWVDSNGESWSAESAVLKKATELGMMPIGSDGYSKPTRELKEFYKKVAPLGIRLPWMGY